MTVLILNPITASATGDDGPSTPSEARAAVAETTARVATLDKKVQAIEAGLRSAQSALSRAQADAEVAQAQFAAASQQVTVLGRQIASARDSLDETQAAIDTQQYLAGLLARQLYTDGPLNEVAIVLDAESPGDMMGRIAALNAIAQHQIEVIGDLSLLRAERADAVNLQAARIVTFQQRQQDAAQALRLANQLRNDARASAAEVARALEAKRLIASNLRSALREDQRRYQQLRAEAARLQKELRARAKAAADEAGQAAGSTPTAPSGSGVLVPPVPGGVTSPYGMRVHPVTGEYKLHTGVDLQASCGQPIRAARSGIVLQAGYNAAYGYRSVIDHGRVGAVSLVTTYNHQVRLGVRTGQRVVTGETIGWVGSTGYSTGCHLHFEVLANGNFTDPMGWI